MILDLLEDHLDEAEHLLGRRELAFRMLSLTGRDLAELDERLRAHLDGILLGGDAAWELCRGYLAEGTSGQAFVAAVLALEGGEKPRLDELAKALVTANGEVAEGVRWACCLSVAPGAVSFLERLLSSSEAGVRAIALDALTFRRVDPGKALDRALASSAAPELASALRGIARLRVQRLQEAVQRHAASEDPMLVVAALEALAILDPESGRQRCLEILGKSGVGSAAAAGLLGVFGHMEDRAILMETMSSEDKVVARAAILSLGDIGDPTVLPFLIDSLSMEGLAGVVGVAIQRVVGSEFSEDDLGATEERDEGAETESWSPDDDLPRFSVEASRAWWNDRQSDLLPGTRYRRGQELRVGQPSPETPLELIQHEAMEHAIASPDEPLLESMALRVQAETVVSAESRGP